MSEMTASELIGEMKKLNRTYTALSRIEELIQFVADLESKTRYAQEESRKAQDLLNITKQTVEELSTTKDSLSKEIKELKSKKETAVKEFNIQTNSLVIEAKKTANDIVNKARAEEVALKNSILELKETKSKLSSEVTQWADEVKALKETFSREKMRIASIFK